MNNYEDIRRDVSRIQSGASPQFLQLFVSIFRCFNPHSLKLNMKLYDICCGDILLFNSYECTNPILEGCDGLRESDKEVTNYVGMTIPLQHTLSYMFLLSLSIDLCDYQ